MPVVGQASRQIGHGGFLVIASRVCVYGRHAITAATICGFHHGAALDQHASQAGRRIHEADLLVAHTIERLRRVSRRQLEEVGERVLGGVERVVAGGEVDVDGQVELTVAVLLDRVGTGREACAHVVGERLVQVEHTLVHEFVDAERVLARAHEEHPFVGKTVDGLFEPLSFVAHFDVDFNLL